MIAVALTRAVDISPVIDPQDQDPPTFLVELVDDAIGTTASRQETRELPSQPVSHPNRVTRERTDEELDDRRGGLLG